ncbi:hypothetical protein E5288_WYG016266 [Bos mutus]|uniref:Uncharacterized protein n=1 Tax=Bos mutus TaxID=72004 RepID=A0A6B0RT72_9CETA|nr:hypothetical protein [Bos mutus]
MSVLFVRGPGKERSTAHVIFSLECDKGGDREGTAAVNTLGPDSAPGTCHAPSPPVPSRRLGTKLVESRAPGKGDLAPTLSGEGEELL